MTERRSKDHPPGVSTPTSVTLQEAATIAVQCIGELTDKPCRGATSVLPSDDGWIVEVEIVEDERIPSTTDILGLYKVEIRRDGAVASYQRIRRYWRVEEPGRGGEVQPEEPEAPATTLDDPRLAGGRKSEDPITAMRHRAGSRRGAARAHDSTTQPWLRRGRRPGVETAMWPWPHC